jgi:predicted metal-dependent hydrolase
LRIHPTDRAAILTMPPRGTIAEAREFAKMHGGWIAARLGRLPKAAPFQVGTVVPLRGVPHRIVHRAGERGTVWTETRDSGEKVLCVAGGAEHMDRRVHDYLKREARKDLHKASDGLCGRTRRPRSSGCRSAISRAAGVHAPRRDHCRSRGG